MGTGRLGDPLPRRVAVLRALQLGDLLCAVPALRALRAALPEAHISLVGLPWSRTFVDRFKNYLDAFIEFPGYPALPEQPPRLELIAGFLTKCQSQRFDLALQMHGGGSVTNPLLVLLGAGLNAGFYQPGKYCPDQERFLAYPDNEPEVRRHLRLLEFLGVPLQGEQLEFPVDERDRQTLSTIEGGDELRAGDYVCVHAGGRAPARRWRPERFALVADRLAARGLRVVLTGSADEIGCAQTVSEMMKSDALNLAGKTSLGALASLLSEARLLVTNDTGVSHLAAGLRVPSVVVHTGSPPERWAPLDRERHRAVYHPFHCRPCSQLSLPNGYACDAGVRPEAVLREAEDLLREGAAHAA
jgi:ADP-heptose:LPS heptosyltransferase